MSTKFELYFSKNWILGRAELLQHTFINPCGLLTLLLWRLT